MKNQSKLLLLSSALTLSFSFVELSPVNAANLLEGDGSMSPRTTPGPDAGDPSEKIATLTAKIQEIEAAIAEEEARKTTFEKIHSEFENEEFEGEEKESCIASIAESKGKIASLTKRLVRNKANLADLCASPENADKRTTTAQAQPSRGVLGVLKHAIDYVFYRGSNPEIPLKDPEVLIGAGGDTAGEGGAYLGARRASTPDVSAPVKGEDTMIGSQRRGSIGYGQVDLEGSTPAIEQPAGDQQPAPSGADATKPATPVTDTVESVVATKEGQTPAIEQPAGDQQPEAPVADSTKTFSQPDNPADEMPPSSSFMNGGEELQAPLGVEMTSSATESSWIGSLMMQPPTVSMENDIPASDPVVPIQHNAQPKDASTNPTPTPTEVGGASSATNEEVKKLVAEDKKILADLTNKAPVTAAKNEEPAKKEPTAKKSSKKASSKKGSNKTSAKKGSKKATVKKASKKASAKKGSKKASAKKNPKNRSKNGAKNNKGKSKALKAKSVR